MGLYPTNYLIGREPLLWRPKAFTPKPGPGGLMRDYPQFPEAIPHQRVSYSRVTQPSAAFHVAEATGTLDLHALGAPPAFTLARGVLGVFGQATKGVRWMPWRQESMKDVASCDKLR